jgi:hypothetical protein
MSIAENIRSLARDGMSTAEIAQKLNIGYRHAYHVLKRSGFLAAGSCKVKAEVDIPTRMRILSKPVLRVEELERGGFELSGRWILSDIGELVVDRTLPKDVGVYAFVVDGVAQYVGVAMMGIAKRLYFYSKPGVTQRTSKRINGILKKELLDRPSIEIFAAFPPDFDWNGFPVHGSAGLEVGMIKKYALPWNKRGTG